MLKNYVGVCFSGIRTMLLGALVFLSVDAHAELLFSYSSDMTDAQSLDGAHVHPTLVYIQSSDSQSSGQALVCCDWVSGPGALEEGPSPSSVVPIQGLHSVDLTDMPAGSVRNASNGGVNGTFTISRPLSFVAPSLADSGAVVVTENNQTIENLSVTSTTSDGCAIELLNVNNITLRNLEISHSNIGICAQNVDGLVIEDVRFVSNSATEQGPHCAHGISDCKQDSPNWANPDVRLAIKLNTVNSAELKRIDITKASGGVFAYRADQIQISDIVCKDIRGPYPRGQCVQFVESDNAQLKNFYTKIWKEQSRSEDNVNIYESDNVLVSEGFIDGNYSVYGVGVIADTGSDNAHVKNVDLINTTVVGVSVWSNDTNKVGKNFLAENIRVKNTSCSSREGQVPSSSGLVFGAHPNSENPRFINSQWYNHCRSMVMWCAPGGSCRERSGGVADIREEDFEPKAPLNLVFPWEVPRPVITEISVQ